MLISKFHFIIRVQLGNENENELRWEIYFQKLLRKVYCNSPIALELLKWTLLDVITTSHITEHQILGYLFPNCNGK